MSKNDSTGHLRGAQDFSKGYQTLSKPAYGDTTNKATAASSQDLRPANIGGQGKESGEVPKPKPRAGIPRPPY